MMTAADGVSGFDYVSAQVIISQVYTRHGHILKYTGKAEAATRNDWKSDKKEFKENQGKEKANRMVRA